MSIQPTVASPPLEGQALNRFVQQWLADVLTGSLAPSLIRPWTQAEPPVIPQDSVAWMAFRQTISDSDTFAYVKAKDDGTGSVMNRQERIDVLCSFYDLGTNGLAQGLASLLRDNLSISDNLETLFPDFGMEGCGDPVTIPSLLKERWLYRVDLPFRLTRSVTRTYGVPNITSANGTLNNDVGAPAVAIDTENT